MDEPQTYEFKVIIHSHTEVTIVDLWRVITREFGDPHGTVAVERPGRSRRRGEVNGA